MFHMLSSFDLKAGVTVEAFQAANTRFAEYMREHGLLESIGPVGRRHKHPVMDTDEREQTYYFITTFVDQAQCDASAAFIMARREPGWGIHLAVIEKVENSVFVCWEDV